MLLKSVHRADFEIRQLHPARVYRMRVFRYLESKWNSYVAPRTCVQNARKGRMIYWKISYVAPRTCVQNASITSRLTR